MTNETYLSDVTIESLITNEYANDCPARYIRMMAYEIKQRRLLGKQLQENGVIDEQKTI